MADLNTLTYKKYINAINDYGGSICASLCHSPVFTEQFTGRLEQFGVKFLHVQGL